MKPRFYSRNAIGIITIILSPFLGCILFQYNVKKIGKGNLSLYFILGGMFWLPLFKKLTDGLNLNILVQLVLANFIGSLILTFYFWDKYFSDYPEYENKNFWKPVLIFVGVCVALILIQILTTK